MSLKDQIQNDMKAALLGGDRFVGEVLRGLKAAILNEEVANGIRDTGLDDASVEKVIAKEVKKRRESAKLYRENNRDDLAEPEEKEAEVLQQYMPEQISEEAILAKVKEKIVTLDAKGPQDMGKVIGALKQDLGNSVDGAMLASVVKSELNK